MAHRKRSNHILIAGTVLVLLILASGLIWFRGCKATSEEKIVKCSVRGPSPEVRQRIDKQLAKKREEVPKERDAGSVTIPVYFHIITNASGTGNIPNEVVNQQIDALNKAFSGIGPTGTLIGADTPFRFSLMEIDIKADEAWYNMPFGSAPSGAERAAMDTLKRGDKSTLNIYTVASTGVLGWARVPWHVAPGEDPAQALDGVVIGHRTLPGGYAFSTTQGDTAVHEVGHWLGLFHVFEDQCDLLGDSVADTPLQYSERFGCPPASSSCGDPDPFENFMNTTNDRCMYQFTPGQSSLMDATHLAFRTPPF